MENESKNDGTAQWGKKLNPSFQEERILSLWYNLEKGATDMKEIWWNAVVENDSTFDGKFFYAVESAVIYCKPSCLSKAPKRENVRFFATKEEAEAA